jgi:hypothetical protein
MPQTSQTAVVRGAVICGVEKSSTSSLAVVAKPCPRSYGIVVDKAYSEVTCDVRDIGRQGETDQMVAAAQMLWLISKGDLVLQNEPRARHEFSKIVKEGGERTGGVKIWSCEKDEEYRPDRFYTNRHRVCRNLERKHWLTGCRDRKGGRARLRSVSLSPRRVWTVPCRK